MESRAQIEIPYSKMEEFCRNRINSKRFWVGCRPGRKKIGWAKRELYPKKTHPQFSRGYLCSTK